MSNRAPQSDSADIARRLSSLLSQLEQFLGALGDQHYTAVLDPGGSAIGAHMRHSLDHVTALLRGVETGRIDYDCRQRGTEVERSRAAARVLLSSCCERLETIAAEDIDCPLIVELVSAPDRPPSEYRSSLGRELMFVLSHTIHHNAIIAVTARRCGLQMPEELMYAPATLQYRRQS